MRGRRNHEAYARKAYNKGERAPLETPLRAYLDAHPEVSPYELAKQLGCDYKSVRMWSNGWTMISLVYAFKLEQVTQGAIPASSWLGTELAKAQYDGGADWVGWQERKREEARRNGPNRRKRGANGEATSAP